MAILRTFASCASAFLLLMILLVIAIKDSSPKRWEYSVGTFGSVEMFYQGSDKAGMNGWEAYSAERLPGGMYHVYYKRQK